MKPLGLPMGSVRAILAIALVGAVIAQALLGQDVADLKDLAAVALAFYFAARSKDPLTP